MQRVLFISVSVFVFFLLESIISHIFGVGWKPNLLIILIVFIDLFRGIRYSLFTAFLAGLLVDSFSAKVFGLNIFAFISCAYVTTVLRIYIYRRGSTSLRLLMVFLVSMINVLFHFLLNLMFYPVHFLEMFVHVFLREVFLTTIVANYVMEQLKTCASRLSV